MQSSGKLYDKVGRMDHLTQGSRLANRKLPLSKVTLRSRGRRSLCAFVQRLGNGFLRTGTKQPKILPCFQEFSASEWTRGSTNMHVRTCRRDHTLSCPE